MLNKVIKLTKQILKKYAFKFLQYTDSSYYSYFCCSEIIILLFLYTSKVIKMRHASITKDIIANLKCFFYFYATSKYNNDKNKKFKLEI